MAPVSDMFLGAPLPTNILEPTDEIWAGLEEQGWSITTHGFPERDLVGVDHAESSCWYAQRVAEEKTAWARVAQGDLKLFKQNRKLEIDVSCDGVTSRVPIEGFLASQRGEEKIAALAKGLRKFWLSSCQAITSQAGAVPSIDITQKLPSQSFQKSKRPFSEYSDWEESALLHGLFNFGLAREDNGQSGPGRKRVRFADDVSPQQYPNMPYPPEQTDPDQDAQYAITSSLPSPEIEEEIQYLLSQQTDYQRNHSIAVRDHSISQLLPENGSIFPTPPAPGEDGFVDVDSRKRQDLQAILHDDVPLSKVFDNWLMYERLGGADIP